MKVYTFKNLFLKRHRKIGKITAVTAYYSKRRADQIEAFTGPFEVSYAVLRNLDNKRTARENSFIVEIGSNA